ncbi:CerR family C-terminal domain-containing protein [Piscinibacter sp.]|uniref:CerR family C-terminal domain-containing protein n=1 Tax=Piscinibacter sp. TaxID=1903157 RepID=UPI0039E7282F
MTDINIAAAPRPARPGRGDGEAARERLLHAALNLFAHQGFATTSTREIAEAAGANLAAIKYYFGDKAGLYRAVFFEMQSKPEDDIRRFGGEALSLREALRGLYLGFLEPLKQGELTTLCMKLHMREMLEPNGLWGEEIEHGIRPMHEALLRVLCRHVGAAAPDEHIERLAVCVAALGVHLHVARDVTDALAPALNEGADALDRWLDALVMYAEAMVASEVRRRASARQP